MKKSSTEADELILEFNMARMFFAEEEEEEEARIVVSLRDITQQKWADKKLRESEEKYRSLVESTEDSVYLVDRDCRYLFINEKHLSRLGVSKDQIIDRTYNELHSKEYNKKAQIKLSVALGYAIQSGQYKDMEKVLEKADENMYTEKLSDIASRENHIIDTLKTVLATRDPHTEKHAERLQNLSEALGKDIGLSEFELKRLRLLALLHDIGKIGTPDNILFKPTKLTEEEWEIMKKHSEEGYKMAKNIPQLVPIARDILYHHERWDGTGYPKGLKGKEIPILSRIISIIDAYDVMLSDRPYRKALSKEEAIQELKENAGTQFDPELVERFLKIAEGKGDQDE